MTDEQIQLLTALSHATFSPASFDKRFVMTLHGVACLAPETELTEPQERTLFQLVHRYRRQLDKDVVKLGRDLQLQIFQPAAEATGVMDPGKGFPYSNHVSPLNLPG